MEKRQGLASKLHTQPTSQVDLQQVALLTVEFIRGRARRGRGGGGGGTVTEYAVSHFVAKQIILQNCMTLTVTNAYQTTTEFGRLLNYSNSYYPPIEQEGRKIWVSGWDILKNCSNTF